MYQAENGIMIKIVLNVVFVVDLCSSECTMAMTIVLYQSTDK